MAEQISPHNESPADKELARVVSKTLDNSLGNIDDLSLQRLKNARLNALQHKASVSRKWVGLSAAASVAVLLLIPVAMHQGALHVPVDDELNVVLQEQEVPYSAEEMDDIEMLMSLEDIDA